MDWKRQGTEKYFVDKYFYLSAKLIAREEDKQLQQCLQVMGPKDIWICEFTTLFAVNCGVAEMVGSLGCKSCATLQKEVKAGEKDCQPEG